MFVENTDKNFANDGTWGSSEKTEATAGKNGVLRFVSVGMLIFGLLLFNYYDGTIR